MLKAAVWVHGNIVQAQDPLAFVKIAGSGQYGTREGWGTTFNCKNAGWDWLTWFHFPMPTPVILDDIRPQLVKVFVLYQTYYTKVSHIHIYDGPQKVRAIDGLNLSGDHRLGVSPSNSWVIDPPITIGYGLGISVGVRFSDPPQAGPNDYSRILFTTAGADFERP